MDTTKKDTDESFFEIVGKAFSEDFDTQRELDELIESVTNSSDNKNE
ncbi:hypothetical protein [Klebsiella aerogenes]|nr:hypothetical protein [Klebsiella aerogenes]